MMMKKALIALLVLEILIAIGVGIAVFMLASTVYAEEVIYIPTMIDLSEESFFELLHDTQRKFDCYVKVSENDEFFIAVVCYGPTMPDEYTIDTIVYNKEQQKALWIGGNVDITAEALKTVENIGLQYPEQYIHEEQRLGFDAFKILEIGEEIDW